MYRIEFRSMSGSKAVAYMRSRKGGRYSFYTVDVLKAKTWKTFAGAQRAANTPGMQSYMLSHGMTTYVVEVA